MNNDPFGEIDDMPLGFGKHQGSTPNEIADTDPSYIVWLYETMPDKCSKALYLAVEQDVREGDAELFQDVEGFGDLDRHWDW